jgi:hypothetical protein
VARSDAGRRLTAQHRQVQLQIRRRTLRDYARLWPLWTGTDETFRDLLAAVFPLVQRDHQASSVAATGYFELFRRAEDARGVASPLAAPPLDEDALTAALYATGRNALRRALDAGQDPESAKQAALVRTSGSVVRHVLKGGRDALVLSTGSDAAAVGWQRVTDAAPCAFCALLATRGPAYRGQSTAEFRAHDHCACTVEPVYDGSDLPPASVRLRELYQQAQREAREAGELQRGTSNDALNAFRRLLSRTDPPAPQ